MSKPNRILSTLSTTLPDERPISSLLLVEALEKCPPGYTPISRTYDQDQDADLWRDASFLKRKLVRYLCISKTEGLPNFVIQEIIIVSDKTFPPGYSLLQKTVDSDQKAWRKKQLCYRLINRRNIRQAVTDIIICSRLKKAPEGFILAGEINGVIICYKMGNIQDTETQGNSAVPQPVPPERPPKPASVGYPRLDGDHDYEILLPGYVPSRPAPQPPVANTQQHSTHTLSSNFNGLEGVPFVLNPKFSSSTSSDRIHFPMIKARTLQQLIRDYEYSFALERQT